MSASARYALRGFAAAHAVGERHEEPIGPDAQNGMRISAGGRAVLCGVSDAENRVVAGRVAQGNKDLVLRHVRLFGDRHIRAHGFADRVAEGL